MSIRHISQADLPTRFGFFTLHVFRDEQGPDLIVLTSGTPQDGCLVRLHSECTTGDILGSLRCDCRDQLEASMRKIAEQGQGILVYLRGHEGRGIGLANKVKAYALQDQGMDTVEANLHLGFPADARVYDSAAHILQYYKLSQIRLLTNNPEKIHALEKASIHVVERIPLWTALNPHNQRYIETKQKVMGHLTQEE